MKYIVIVLLFFCVAFAQEREFDMNMLNQNIGELIENDTGNVAADGDVEEQDGIGVIILRIFGSLALVLALVGGTAWIFKKTGAFKKSGIEAAAQTPTISVMEALYTGQNGVILLLKCEDSVFLVGQTQSQYTLLQELNNETAKKIIESKAGDETVTGFKSSLNSFMKNIKVKNVKQGI